MKKLLLAWSETFITHDAGPDHPENSIRIKHLISKLQSSDWSNQIELVKVVKATVDAVSAVHNPKYVEAIRRICDAGGIYHPALQANLSKNTWDAALYSAGAGITLADRILKGEAKVGFAPVRPPGHHAVYERPLGFCIFNNIAITAKWLIEKHNFERILIFDFDVHQGNGTEELFIADKRVLFASIHQTDHFPSNSGKFSDIGIGEGEGFTINVPIQPKANDDDVLKAIDRYITPQVEEFKPQFVLVSAGFDMHQRDILGNINLTNKGFSGIAERVQAFANFGAEGRIVSLLEGGYDYIGLAEGAEAYLSRLVKE